MGCMPSKDDKSLNEAERKAFDNLPADKKLEYMWKKIEADPNGRGWEKAFTEQIKLIVDTDLNDVVHHTGDHVPSHSGDPGAWQRTKTIHLHGSHGIVEWRSFGNHDYTGVYAGATDILARFSIAAPADWNEEKTDGRMIPGFALKKFHAPGEQSSNMICMHSLDGGNTNFFDADFTNHLAALNLDAESTTLANKILAKKFATLKLVSASKLGSSDLATHDAKGKALPKDDVKFPFRVVFHPPPEMRKLFIDTYPPEKDSDQFVSKQLVQIPADTVLFKIFAEEQPGKGLSEQPIGELILRKQFITSKFGDNDLFFRHPSVDEDLKWHPEWEEAIREQEKYETSLDYAFRNPMAPDVEDPK